MGWHVICMAPHAADDRCLESAKSTCAFGEDAWNVPILRPPATSKGSCSTSLGDFEETCIRSLASQRATSSTERAPSPYRTGIKCNGLYHIQHKAAAITGDHPNGCPPRHLKDGASAAGQRASPPKNGGWLVVWTPMFGHVPVLQYQYALRSTSFQALPYQDAVWDDSTLPPHCSQHE